MKPITTLTDAQEATNALAEFWARFNAMVGQGEVKQTTTHKTTPQQRHPAPQSPLSPMQQKLVEIVKAAGGKITTPDLVSEYQKVDSDPAMAHREKAYIRVYGCAANMARKGHLFKRGKTFSLPATTAEQAV